MGATMVAVLVFPTDFLRLDAPEGTGKKPLLILESAQAGKATEIGFFFSREPSATLEPKFLQIGKPIFMTDLANGEVVWMVPREADFDASKLASAEQFGRAAGRLLDRDAFPAPGIERSNLNAILWNSPKDGEALRIIEMGGITLRRIRLQAGDIS
jgi:hypothetical protein